MNIYLDIYGTLIANASPIADREALLYYILDNFRGHVFWLTSFSEPRIPEVLAREYSDPLLSRLLDEVQYISYGHYKSDMIDYETPFLWLDDNQSEADYYALKEHNALDNYVQITPSDPDMAKKAQAIIESRSYAKI